MPWIKTDHVTAKSEDIVSLKIFNYRKFLSDVSGIKVILKSGEDVGYTVTHTGMLWDDTFEYIRDEYKEIQSQLT